MPTDPPVILEAIAPDGRGLRVSFVWRRDRYAHIVQLVREAGPTPILATREGDDQDDWPASPPFQQLGLETRAEGRPVALLVGMAGKSHWSAGVEAFPQSAQVIFDVACRLQTKPKWLGSVYRSMTSVEVRSPQAALLDLDDIRCRLEIGSLNDQPRPQLTSDNEGVSLELASVPERFPATIRWTYTLTALSGRG